MHHDGLFQAAGDVSTLAIPVSKPGHQVKSQNAKVHSIAAALGAHNTPARIAIPVYPTRKEKHARGNPENHDDGDGGDLKA